MIRQLLSLIVTQIEEETRTRAMKMALVHDMSEALTGDITPSDKISKGLTLPVMKFSSLNNNRGEAPSRASRLSVSRVSLETR
jgi:hypothetical protein